MASDPDHADCLATLRTPASFDYAQLERRMWEGVDAAIKEYAGARALGPGHPQNHAPDAVMDGTKLRVAIKNYAFSYRLAKTEPRDGHLTLTLPTPVPGQDVEALPAIPGYRWVMTEELHFNEKGQPTVGFRLEFVP